MQHKARYRLRHAYKSVVDTEGKGVLVVDTQDAHFPKKLLNIKQKDPNKPLTDRDIEENYLAKDRQNLSFFCLVISVSEHRQVANVISTRKR